MKRRRQVWLEFHLWLGLILGLIFAVIGLTGSILVFHHEIDEWLNPELLVVTPNPEGRGAYQSLDRIVASARQALPPSAKMTFAYYPRSPGVAIQFFVSVPIADDAVATRRHEQRHLFIDPYTAAVTGQRIINSADWSHFIPRSFIAFVFSLHYALLIPEIGGTVVGICTILLCFSLLTGLILFWPLDGNWRRAFSIELRKSGIRLNHDIHKAAGFWSVPILFAVLISGIYFVLPQQFMALLHVFSPEAVRRYEVKPADVQGEPKRSIGEILAIVQDRFPEGRPSWIYLPNTKRPTATICQEAAMTKSMFIDRRCVVLNADSGEILHVEEAGTRTAGDTFIAWQWPLHSGQAFGWPGRILVFLCGLACPVIFVTGVIRWLQKRRARAKQSARLATPTPIS